jgi:uncharacterized membrane protein
MRRVRAKKLSEVRTGRSPQEQLDLLDQRLGVGEGAERERARLLGEVYGTSKTPIAEDVCALMTAPIEKGEFRHLRERKIKDAQAKLSPSERKRLGDMVHTVEKDNRTLIARKEQAREELSKREESGDVDPAFFRELQLAEMRSRGKRPARGHTCGGIASLDCRACQQDLMESSQHP